MLCPVEFFVVYSNCDVALDRGKAWAKSPRGPSRISLLLFRDRRSSTTRNSNNSKHQNFPLPLAIIPSTALQKSPLSLQVQPYTCSMEPRCSVSQAFLCMQDILQRLKVTTISFGAGG